METRRASGDTVRDVVVIEVSTCLMKRVLGPLQMVCILAHFEFLLGEREFRVYRTSYTGAHCTKCLGRLLIVLM